MVSNCEYITADVYVRRGEGGRAVYIPDRENDTVSRHCVLRMTDTSV
jgi:hypothetical protein